MRRKKAREGQNLPFILNVLTKTTQHTSHKSSGLLFHSHSEGGKAMRAVFRHVSQNLPKLTKTNSKIADFHIRKPSNKGKSILFAGADGEKFP